MVAVRPLLLVGCGKMGAALVRGWLARGVAEHDLTIVEPATPALDPGTAQRLSVVPDLATLTREAGGRAIRFAAVVFAIKPQAMGEALGAYRTVGGPETVFISIAAGRTLSGLTGMLGNGAAVVRAMPNTPAAIGRGISVAVANATTGDRQRALADELLAATGRVLWVTDEGLLDAVTAVSGSGPAYVFLLAECLAEAGVAAGLPPELAAELARATVAGSGELLRLSDRSAAQLRQDVTSPGGTTAAALGVLMGENGLKELMMRAVAVATRRSRELAN